jgi:parallel beta-helix repeat protein
MFLPGPWRRAGAIASLTLFVLLQDGGGLGQPALAAPSPLAAQGTQPSAEPATLVILVNPLTGNDATGNGTTIAPFKTITRALQAAQPDTVIQLLPGTYSTTTGEVFPLRLKPGVKVQGDAATRGQAIVLKGGGLYNSATSMSQNVTLVGANQATVEGITITNPVAQGYGLWIESTQPTILDSTFTGNGQAAIAIYGTATPLILNNFFYDNVTDGITVNGTARPKIQDNVFEQMAIAVQIHQNSAPWILRNRMTHNQQGIVVLDHARPILRNNSVENNVQDGLVLVAQAQPDLGTIASPGGNWLRNNGRFDLNNQAHALPLLSTGNEIIKQSGPLALAPAVVPSRPQPIAPPQRSPLTERPPEAGASPRPQPSGNPTPTPTPSLALVSAPMPAPVAAPPQVQTPISAPRQNLTPPSQAILPPLSATPKSTVEPPSISANSFPVPAPRRFFVEPRASAPAPRMRTVLSPLVAPAVARSPRSVEVLPPKIVPAPLRIPTSAVPVTIPVPPPESSSRSSPTSGISQPSPTLSLNLSSRTALQGGRPIQSNPAPSPAWTGPPATNLLPVPDPNIPIGNVGSSSQVPVYRSSQRTDGVSPPVPVSRALALGYRYRVYVAPLDADQAVLVRKLVPDAFMTRSQGRAILQVGLFRDRPAAEELMQSLSGQGILAATETLE